MYGMFTSRSEINVHTKTSSNQQAPRQERAHTVGVLDFLLFLIYLLVLVFVLFLSRSIGVWQLLLFYMFCLCCRRHSWPTFCQYKVRHTSVSVSEKPPSIRQQWHDNKHKNETYAPWLLACLIESIPICMYCMYFGVKHAVLWNIMVGYGAMYA